MKILFINTSDSGGAGTACIRIHQALLAEGIDSNVLVLNKTKNIQNVYLFDYWADVKNRVHKIYKIIKKRRFEKQTKKRKERLAKSSVCFSFPTSIFDVTTHPLYKEADIIVLNWVSGFLDEPSFFKKNTKPIIWRMADLYICGGGNHYEKNFPIEMYDKYVKSNIGLRKSLLKNQNVFLVPISNWTKTKAEESELTIFFPKQVIHNGLDLNTFKPFDKSLAREFWNFPEGKKILLFGADGVLDVRKGMAFLLEAIKEINTEDIIICSFGGNEYIENVVSVGRINDDRLLTLLFSAVDFFVMPSIEETFGQVTIEALACGVPVISFPNGGSQDIINHGFNGFLTDEFTSESLRKYILKALDFDFNREQIRLDAINRFNIIDKAKEYIQLFNEIKK